MCQISDSPKREATGERDPFVSSGGAVGPKTPAFCKRDALPLEIRCAGSPHAANRIDFGQEHRCPSGRDQKSDKPTRDKREALARAIRLWSRAVRRYVRNSIIPSVRHHPMNLRTAYKLHIPACTVPRPFFNLLLFVIVLPLQRSTFLLSQAHSLPPPLHRRLLSRAPLFFLRSA